MGERWTNERAWEWYNSRPWIRGCNFMPSDCANRVEMWQSYEFESHFETADRELGWAEELGFNSMRLILEFDVWDMEHDAFMEHLERYLSLLARHGMTAMLVLANECSVPKAFWKRATMGPQHYDHGYHGGKKVSPHGSLGELSYHTMDVPELETKYYAFVREIISKYAKDERVLVWNLWNEPGNNRADLSLSYMERFFEIARKIDPIQPLCADCFCDFYSEGSIIGERACELSDIISYHNYNDLADNIAVLEKMRLIDRPMLNTEWLHRIQKNRVEEMYPLMYLEKIAAYNWGFVAGKYQTYEPWNGVWEKVDAGADLDVTLWQHDLLRPAGRPYDPREIKLIKEYNARADERFEKGLDAKLFGRR